MARKLRPTRPRRHRGLRLSIPGVALPLLGLLVLIQASSLRSPLSESEAPLAIAVRYPTRGLAAESPPPQSAAATAVARVGGNVLGTSEFRLRALGVFVGCAALGLLVWLGERLFSTRAGVLAAVVLIATPAGRALLGTEFGVEPFYLLTMILALGAIRNLSNERRSLIHAGIAGGAAIALVGPSATWIPMMAVLWLRRLRGLTWRSFAIAVAVPVATAVVFAVLSGLALGVAPLPLPASLPPPGMSIVEFSLEALQLIPFTPLVLLGFWNVPKAWRRQGSPRYMSRWIFLTAAALLLFGAFSPLWVALSMVLALASSWAVGRAQRAPIAAAVGASVALGLVFNSFGGQAPGFDVDRWAVRETGKFLRRNLDATSVIGAPPAARSRLVYYATRTIAPLGADAPDLGGLDYVVVDRSKVDGVSPAAGATSRPPREFTLYGHRLQVVAEFGSWILARVIEA